MKITQLVAVVIAGYCSSVFSGTEIVENADGTDSIFTSVNSVSQTPSYKLSKKNSPSINQLSTSNKLMIMLVDGQ